MKWEMESSIMSRRNIFCLDRYGLNIAGLIKYFNRILRSNGEKRAGRDTAMERKKRATAIVM